MERYKVAVVIPCWNCGQKISETLDCIVSQTLNDWKLWCVDDQSTDNTREVINRFANRDSRIHLVVRDREPKGAQTCRNTGFDCAEGAEYVIWFDSDDLIAPYCLEQRVDFMDQHPELDFAVFKAKSYHNDIIDVDGCELFGYEYPPCDDLRRMLRRTLPFVGWTNIYKRESLLKVHLDWDEKVMSLQDSDFNIQTLLRGLRYAFATEFPIDYFYRMNQQTGTISSKIFTKEHMRSHLYFISKLYDTLSSEQLRRYRYELDGYLLYFINNFKGNEFVKQLYSLPVLRRRWWFLLRLNVYSIIRGRSLHLLFPILINYNRSSNARYWKENKLQLKKETDIIKRLLKNE